MIEANGSFKASPCLAGFDSFIFDAPLKRNALEQGFLVEFHLGTRDIRQNLNPIQLNNPIDDLMASIIVQGGQRVAFDPSTLEMKNVDNSIRIPTRKQTVSESFFVFTTSLKQTVIHLEIFSPKENQKMEAVVMLGAPVVSLWQESKPMGGTTLSPLTFKSKSVGNLIIEHTVIRAHPDKFLAQGPSSFATAGSRKTAVLVGHRGIGMNRPYSKAPYLQIGENTIASLSKAADFGADFVEFDVQLTKDDIPIIYHDFASSEFNTQVSNVPYSQFAQKKPQLVRSQSAVMRNKSGDASVENANSIGFIQCPFATLEEAFKVCSVN